MERLMLCTLALLTILQLPSIRGEVKVVYVPTTIPPCTYNYAPVCGSDGVTYFNQCLLDHASDESELRGLGPITPRDESQCTGCKCQKVDLPVCTLDGITYPNECELSCENIQRIQQKEPIIYLAYRKPCLGPPCGCTTIASPVCGTDNVLYRNECVLNCTATFALHNGYLPIALKNAGACTDGCLCPSKLEPVCGSDTMVYDNLCKLECQNHRSSCSKNTAVTIAHSNICNVCDCSYGSNPVCGSDGLLEPRTYQNPCHLKWDSKRTQNPYLKKISDGPCPSCYCMDVYSPVCGSDSKTYRNLCQLECSNEGLNENEQAISLSYYGECKTVSDYCDCSYCSGDHDPVCGDDNISYWNKCTLNCNSECNKRSSHKEISLAKNGPC